MFYPHCGEGLLDVFEVEEEAEDELVSQDRLARDDERERELDRVVQCERIDSCSSFACAFLILFGCVYK